MGIESIIENMPEKRKKLIQNLISVGVILTIAYMFFGFAGAGDYMSFMQSSEFITGAMILLFCFIAWSIMSGKKLHFPEQNKKGQKKKEFNIPNPYAPQQQRQQTQKRTETRPRAKKKKPHLSVQKTRKGGSWYCSGCGSLVIGNTCKKCGSRRN